MKENWKERIANIQGLSREELLEIADEMIHTLDDRTCEHVLELIQSIKHQRG